VAVVLIVAGILGLVYGKFSYTKETHDVKLRTPLKLPPTPGALCGGAVTRQKIFNNYG
jgi:hypothetical protein